MSNYQKMHERLFQEKFGAISYHLCNVTAYIQSATLIIVGIGVLHAVKLLSSQHCPINEPNNSEQRWQLAACRQQAGSLG